MNARNLKRMRNEAYENALNAIKEYLFIDAQIKSLPFRHMRDAEDPYQITRAIDGEIVKIHFDKSSESPVSDVVPSWDEENEGVNYTSDYTLMRLFENEVM